MIGALVSACIVAIAVYAGLSLAEAAVHRLRKNPDKNYRWGVWLFSVLSFAYTFITSLGRQ